MVQYKKMALKKISSLQGIHTLTLLYTETIQHLITAAWDLHIDMVGYGYSQFKWMMLSLTYRWINLGLYYNSNCRVKPDNSEKALSHQTWRLRTYCLLQNSDSGDSFSIHKCYIGIFFFFSLNISIFRWGLRVLLYKSLWMKYYRKNTV